LATCTDSSATSRMISRSVSDSGAWRRYASAYVLLPCSAGTEVELVAEDRSARATDGHRAAWVDIEQLARLVPCRERSTAHMAAFWNDRHPRGWTRRAPWSVRHPRGWTRRARHREWNGRHLDDHGEILRDPAGLPVYLT
jgi:hypothetical protein